MTKEYIGNEKYVRDKENIRNERDARTEEDAGNERYIRNEIDRNMNEKSRDMNDISHNISKTSRDYLTGTIQLSRSEDGSSKEMYYIKSVIGEGSSAVCYEASRKLKNGVVETGKLKEFYPIDADIGKQSWYYSLRRLPNGQLIPGAGTVRKFKEECQDYIDNYKLLKKVMADNPQNEVLKNYIQHGEILYGCPQSEINETKEGAATDEREEREKRAEEFRQPTVYIWSPGVVGKGFDVYLEEVRKNPSKRPEQRLKDILCVIDVLTDCIKALHTAGLMHMDIKPSNFLVPYDSDFGINPNNVSLFDINTLCSIHSKFLRAAGTRGYCAPEIRRGKADNRSDIYSIGAMLFYAVVITEGAENKENEADKLDSDGLYSDEYYMKIDQLVRHSKLFQSSEINSDAVLMSKICKILKKCLARNPRGRYQSCSELKEDLSRVRQRLEKLLWKPLQRSEKGLTDSTIVIQKLLYEHPLYEAMKDGEKELNVLVIGSGTYGQKFIDICLQTGQMAGVQLNITAVSNELEEEKESYLRFRPALFEFVNIDNAWTKKKRKEKTAFANLKFLEVPYKAIYEPREMIKNIFEEAAKEKKECQYIFVALGEDKLNQSIARVCAEELHNSLGYVCPVAYVSRKIKYGRREDIEKKIYAVCINEPITAKTIDKNLGQMAFNTHISWNSTLNIDMARERKKFFESEEEKDKYNRRSSLAYALSIKYKLHSFHIDCEDRLEAAKLFSEQVLRVNYFDNENDRVSNGINEIRDNIHGEISHSSNNATNDKIKRKFQQLVDLEHRRWVLEKVVDGWTAPRDKNGKLKLMECAIHARVRDNVNRTHPCLVYGSETSPLSSLEYRKNHHAKWNEGEIDESLDELDRMSIELHRCFRQQAKQLKNDGLLQNPDLMFVQQVIPPTCENVLRAFRQFQFALKNILNGVKSYSLQYNYYEDAFKDTLKQLPDEIRVKIEKRLNVIDRAFFPVIESNLYRDYKANDEILIKKIPFILTYRHPAAVAMAFEDGKYQNRRNEAIFANVAAATVLSPEKICFFYCFNEESRVDLLTRKLDAVFQYFKKRNVHCKIEFIVSCLEKVSDEDRQKMQESLEKLQMYYSEKKENMLLRDGVDNGLKNSLNSLNRLNGLSNGIMEKVKIFDVHDYDEAANLFVQYLRENQVDLYDGDNCLFPSSYDNALFLGQISKLKIPYFEFDWRKKQFRKCIGCEYLAFVRDDSFIRIQDMFVLRSASNHKFHLPEYAEDYENLWEIYTGQYLDKGKGEKIGDETGEKISEKIGHKKFEDGVKNWNRLCFCLEKYEKERKPLARMAIYAAGNQMENESIVKNISYFLPEYTFSTVKMILQKLIQYNVAKPQSSLINYASDTCKLELIINEEYEQPLNTVFSNPQILLPYYGVCVCKYQVYQEEYVEIRSNNLTVTDANLDCDETGKERCAFDVLEQLEKAHFISQLRKNESNPKLVSFVYSSPRIKQVLISAGKIVEIYAYYDVLKTGYFDDVMSDCEFCLEDGKVKNKLALVLTKGFKSMIVECKVEDYLKADYYYKLHSISDQFGVGTTKVLIGSACKSSMNENEVQKSRGDQLSIKTISSEDEISHIGWTLKKLMEEEK